MLGLLAMAPARQWPALIAGGLLGSVASDLVSNYTVSLALAAAGANLLESVAGALVMRRWLGPIVSLTTLRSVGVLAIGVALLSNAVTSLAGAAMLYAGFGIPFARSWFIWWVGDGLGMLIVAPVLLTWIEALRQRRPCLGRARRRGRGPAGPADVGGVCHAGPDTGLAGHARPLPVVPAPGVGGAALRAGGCGDGHVRRRRLRALARGARARSVRAREHSGIATAILEAYAYLAVASVTSLLAAVALCERQHAIGQLRESRERYRNVVETATDAILTVGPDNRITFANSASERIFGYHPAELLDRDLALLLPAEAGAGWQGPLRTGRHKDGREIPLEVSFGEILEPGAAEFTAVVRDISEKHEAERALQSLEEQYRQSQKMEAIGQLAGGIAHDFNNLLTIVQVNCELLDEQLAGRRDLRPEVQQIRTASQRAAALTRQLLAFSRRQVLAPGSSASPIRSRIWSRCCGGCSASTSASRSGSRRPSGR